MKVVGYCALHYGLPYLEWAIRSVIDHVDTFYVLYSPHGSHNGNRGTLPPIDTEADLQAAVRRGAGDKLVWVRGEWSQENHQRAAIYDLAPDADVIVVVDSDEIWPADLAQGAIALAELNPHIKNWRVPIVHYWRSFYRSVLHDPAYPVRVIRPSGVNESTIPVNLFINHFGYALPPEYIAYKWGGIHGHQAELRKDVDWFKDRYLANAQIDCHPIGSEYWNPERVDPADYMPRFMMEHPYYYKGVIE